MLTGFGQGFLCLFVTTTKKNVKNSHAQLYVHLVYQTPNPRFQRGFMCVSYMIRSYRMPPPQHIRIPPIVLRASFACLFIIYYLLVFDGVARWELNGAQRVVEYGAGVLENGGRALSALSSSSSGSSSNSYISPHCSENAYVIRACVEIHRQTLRTLILIPGSKYVCVCMYMQCAVLVSGRSI